MARPGSAPADLVFDGEHVQLLHFARPSRVTIISFDIMHARANGRNAFARSLCERLGYVLLAVVPKYPCWYPAAEMERVAQLCRTRIAGEAIAYGASMGGYGALRWGMACGARHVLACSPQASIDPAFTGQHDRRYGRHFQSHLHAAMQVRCAHLPANALVLFDPGFRPDAYHAGYLTGDCGAGGISLPHIRHGSAACVAGAANAARIFAALQEGDFPTIRRLTLGRRKELGLYRLHLADAALGRGRHDLAARLAEGAREQEPVPYRMFMGKRAKIMGDHAQAIRHFRRALALKPGCRPAEAHLERLRGVAADPP